jgi:hypothetical protein
MRGGKLLTLAIDGSTVMPFDILTHLYFIQQYREETFNIFLSQHLNPT